MSTSSLSLVRLWVICSLVGGQTWTSGRQFSTTSFTFLFLDSAFLSAWLVSKWASFHKCKTRLSPSPEVLKTSTWHIPTLSKIQLRKLPEFISLTYFTDTLIRDELWVKPPRSYCKHYNHSQRMFLCHSNNKQLGKETGPKIKNINRYLEVKNVII